MRILTIGNIYGEDFWKELGDLESLVDGTSTTPEYDKYIFMGTYFDSQWRKNSDISDNFDEIAALKALYPNHVELLMSKSDIQYYYAQDAYMHSTLYRPDMYTHFNSKLLALAGHLKFAFAVNNVLWTSAGVSDDWAHAAGHITGTSASNIADDLNSQIASPDTVVDICASSGGNNDYSGPLWLTTSELSRGAAEWIEQVIGNNGIMRPRSNKYSTVVYSADTVTRYEYVTPYQFSKTAVDFELGEDEGLSIASYNVLSPLHGGAVLPASLKY